MSTHVSQSGVKNCTKKRSIILERVSHVREQRSFGFVVSSFSRRGVDFLLHNTISIKISSAFRHFFLSFLGVGLFTHIYPPHIYIYNDRRLRNPSPCQTRGCSSSSSRSSTRGIVARRSAFLPSSKSLISSKREGKNAAAGHHESDAQKQQRRQQKERRKGGRRYREYYCDAFSSFSSSSNSEKAFSFLLSSSSHSSSKKKKKQRTDDGRSPSKKTLFRRIRERDDGRRF